MHPHLALSQQLAAEATGAAIARAAAGHAAGTALRAAMSALQRIWQILESSEHMPSATTW